MQTIADQPIQILQIAESLKVYEGFSPTEYRDSQGLRTIGYGHRLWPTESIESITEPAAFERLIIDVKKAKDGARANYHDLDSLPEPAQRALISMSFQLGMHGLSKFVSLKKAIEHRNWRQAAMECLNSKWSKQTPQRSVHCVNLFLSLLGTNK